MSTTNHLLRTHAPISDASWELLDDEARTRLAPALGARGAPDTDLTALDEAAHRMAVAENTAVFHGLEGALDGIVQRSPHEPIPLGAPGDYPAGVATAVSRLLGSGVGGPFGLALGDEPYRLAVGGSEAGGYPLREHLQEILEGPIVWAPGLEGAVVVSRRGGDFLFASGQDLSVGYASHDDAVVQLYIEQSLSFRVATPEAAVALSA